MKQQYLRELESFYLNIVVFLCVYLVLKDDKVIKFLKFIQKLVDNNNGL